MFASVTTFALEGVESREVTVEVDVRPGLPAFSLVGLPDVAVREARERVRAGLQNAGLDFPLKRITANLAPASLPKAGPGFDLAIAIGVLVASGQVPATALEGTAVWGEVSLNGRLRALDGALATALGARAAGFTRLIVPEGNAAEAALVDELESLGVPSLALLFDLLLDRWSPGPASAAAVEEEAPGPDLMDVRGQPDARRALEIAAAGGHNLLMVGPPGAGKTMVARRLPGILAPPTRSEALEITRIHSAAGSGTGALARARPFRAPHHTTSPQGLVGGGARPRPGEITLAHRGVLFLDELGEFSRAGLEALRQPMEDGCVEIVRGQRAVRFPARFMLVGACNPCPCARAPEACTCDETARARYQRRLSGPLLDRIDIVCQVSPPPVAELTDQGRSGGERSAVVRERVIAARERQRYRLAGSGALCNADMGGPAARRQVPLGGRPLRSLRSAAEGGGLTGRGYDRVLRLARTIADLEGAGPVTADHLAEALAYRLAPPTAVAA